ncbi:kinase-like protein [Corynespora cassiicola Philippines]|uniref:Kinase-like protein n=1 Tax=Corynespora cassiicola Philippines TaxID=1448308 RepID=A0A2T2NL20_CORCC|nr:kinase-like protein [Corynespora cassiicola Philippines]
MSDSELVESDKPTYQVLKYIGGGGFGQVFKVERGGHILACKQIQFSDVKAALSEYDHMKLLRDGPHIAAIHYGLEFSHATETLSFFMDYYKGKDLDRHVRLLKGAGESFLEPQVIDIGHQIAEALEFCHSRNILHQDIKPMNVLLKDKWNPLTDLEVPDLFVADFGLASRVGTIGTRFTGQRGTPGYEAPEIREQGYHAAFSQKSDIYAFGCVLYRLCTLEDPDDVDDLKPEEISDNYSIDLLGLISCMLSSDRDHRPTAAQVKAHLLSLMPRYLPNARSCRTCGFLFVSANQLRKHLKQTGHYRQVNPSGPPAEQRFDVEY